MHPANERITVHNTALLKGLGKLENCDEW